MYDNPLVAMKNPFAFLTSLPPPAHPDLEDAERTRVLRIILWALIALNTLILALSPIIPGRGPFLRMLAAGSFLYLLSVGCFFLNARGKTRPATILLMTGLTIVLTGLALTAGGIRANAAHGYVVVMALAGLLLGEAALFVALGFFAFLSFGLVLIEIAGYLPPDVVAHSPFVLWSGFLYILIAIACLQFLNNRMVRNALFKTQRELERRRLTEEELQKQKGMLSTILNAIPQSVFWKDRRGVYLGCNEMFARETGLERPESVEGKTDLELHWPSVEAEAYRRDDFEVMDAHRPKLHIVEPLNRADGKRIWVDTSKAPLLDSDGFVYGVVGILEDITERKKAEEVLRESEERFSKVFSSSPVGITISSAEGGRIIDVNDAALAMFGYSRDELIGMFGPGLGIWVDQDERDRLLDRITREGKLAQHEARLRTSHGELRDFMLSSEIITVGGKQCILTLWMDITDRKRAEMALQKREALFRAVVENSHDAVVLLDVERHIKYVSPSFSRIAGYVPQEIEGTFGPTYTHPDDRPHTESKFRELLRSPGENLSLEYRVLHKAGHWIWIEVSATNLLDDPDVRAIVLNIRDVTERKHAAEALQDSMEQLHLLSAELEHAREQERKSTAREVHDELGQILTAIRMGVEKAAREGVIGPPGNGAETHSLLALVDQGILGVQRIAARLRPGMLDDLGLLAAMEWRVEEFQKQSGITCTLSLPATEPAIDEDRSTALFRIMGELLTNVARHAKATEVAVSLTETGEEFVMSVKDNGIGIADTDVAGPKALGFKGIQERLYPFGGRCIIPPGFQPGTYIVIHLPKTNPLRRNTH